MDITIKENINNMKDTKKKSSFAKFNMVEQLPSTNNLYDTYLIEKDEKIYKMNLFRFGESINLDIFEKLNNIKNVNHLVESGQEGDRLYLLWKVLDYPNLGEVEVSIDEFLRKISTILANLHKKKIYHLNLNLENIKVKNQNPLEIIIDDFASASITDAEASKKLTNVKGIDMFQSPELSLGIASSKSDYWSLGIILYYLLTKTLPEKNTYTKEILLDNIPSKYENLIKGLLSIDLNKRYGKEEIDIVLGGGKVEEIAGINSTLNSFTYEGKTFNSLEDFALFLHDEKKGLDTFKKLLYRGFFDKYLDKILLSKLKNSIGELNSFFYHYGKVNQQLLFENYPLYRCSLWFSKEEIDTIRYVIPNDDLSILVDGRYQEEKDLEEFHFELKKVKYKLNLDSVPFNKKAIEYIAYISLTNKDLCILDRIFNINDGINYIKLFGLYEEVKNLNNFEIIPYIKHKYIVPSSYYPVEFSNSSFDRDYFYRDFYNIKYIYYFHKKVIFDRRPPKELINIHHLKSTNALTKYLLSKNEKNDFIKKTYELEYDSDLVQYYNHIHNYCYGKKEKIEARYAFLVSIYLAEKENTLAYLKENLKFNELENIFVFFKNNDFQVLEKYIKKIFKIDFIYRVTFEKDEVIEEFSCYLIKLDKVLIKEVKNRYINPSLAIMTSIENRKLNDALYKPVNALDYYNDIFKIIVILIIIIFFTMIQ